MASDTKLSFGMLHGCAHRDCASARRIREPAIPHVDQEIHARAHSFMRIFIWRHIVKIGMQLIGWMIRGYAYVVLLSGLKDAGTELVEPRIILSGFDLV